MRSSAELKIKGGKLVEVILECSDHITGIKILGDFFIYPDDSLYRIEKALIGLSANASKGDIIKAINRTIAEEKAELIGITPEAIAETTVMAVKKCSGE
jgi:lipoate-protein ligase A